MLTGLKFNAGLVRKLHKPACVNFENENSADAIADTVKTKKHKFFFFENGCKQGH